MATIVKRRRGDGSTAYRATIRIKRAGKLLHQETKTFSRNAVADAWAARRELELEHPGALDRARVGDASLGSLLRRYALEYSELGRMGRSKTADLARIQSYDIARAGATSLTAGALIDHVRKRRLEGAGPATVLNDLVWIGVVLRTAKTAWGLPVHPEAVTEARSFCMGHGLVARPQRRDRRPTPDELGRLTAYFRQRPRSDIPMADIMWFAIHSCRRQDEITSLLRADLDRKHHAILVRDMKHPRTAGISRTAKLTRDAMKLLLAQPRGPERFFPYDPKTVGAAFTRACKVLGITDLRFHDLRHDGTSRLFEAGYQIHEVAQFTLHQSWAELKRYTQLRPERLKLR